MKDFDAVMIAEGAQDADDETTIQAWQHLIDTGLCWRLQGWFGRRATELIENGTCRSPDQRDDDQEAWDEAVEDVQKLT
jgi:hypothetical protein